MQTLRVKAAGPLLAFLFAEFKDIPKTRIKKWLRLQCVSVNGKTVTGHAFGLFPQDEVRVEPGKKTPLAMSSSPKIIFEDEHILVAEKPAGLLTVGTSKVKTKTAYFELNEWLRSVNPKRPERVFIVHRLDRETSGLLVFAKSEAAKFKLQRNWDQVEKFYTAVVEGVPRVKEDTLKSYLAQNKTLKVYSTDEDESTKLAVTHYRMLKTDGRFSVLDVFPRTGRKNQIRVQLADIGNPVAGDEKYGAKEDPAGRLCLHARELSFKHPVTDQVMRFRSEVPKELSRIVR